MKLTRSFLQNKDLNSPAVTYDRTNEHMAVTEYCSLYHYRVFRSGLCIKEQQPWLCWSPDGIALSSNDCILLEIKCPFFCREKPIIEENIINVP